MNFLKRGLLSVWAKKGRTILLIAVFSAILIFVLAGLTIQSATEKATENAEKSAGATATLSVNRESMFEERTQDSSGESGERGRPDPGSFNVTPVELSDAKKIAKLYNVASYSFETSATAVAGDDIEPITSSDSEDTMTSTEGSDGAGGMMGGGPGGGGMMMQEMNNGDFQISGVSSTAMASNFSSGTAEITDGEGITAEDEGTNHVVIESSLAEANDLKVGDTFTLQNTDEDASYEVTVKGIYETSESVSGMAAQISFMNPVNTLYAYYTFGNTLNGDEDAATVDSAVYNLSDPSKMDAFVEEAEALIDTDTYSITTNDQMYQQMLEPVNNVSSFAKNIVFLVAVAGIIILTLIVMLMIRERRYEIGVLLSMGEARVKVILQFFSEMFIAMVVALVIAGFSGNIVGNVLGNQLLAQQTESEETTQAAPDNAQGEVPEIGEGNGGGPGGGGFGGLRQGMGDMLSSMSGSVAITELDVTVAPAEIAMLAGLGLLICFVSILLSSIGILRLNPKKILVT